MGHNNACYCFLLLFTLTRLVGSSQAETDAQILLRFKNSLSNYTALADWIDSGPGPCDTPNWTGLRCINGTVFGLKLEGMGLKGKIDIPTLTLLPLLRTLSFMNNSFDGPLPDVSKLTSLRALYLSYNGFSGGIDKDGFAGMKSLQKVFMARNNFSGEIPKSIAALPSLLQLSLEGNGFEGRIPEFEQTDLVFVDLANNKLEGRIPDRLSNMNSSLFAGNKDLCGKPLPKCKSSSKKRTIIIIVVVAGSVVALAAIVAVYYIRNRPTATSQSKKVQEKEARGVVTDKKEDQSPDHDNKNAENAKLYFARNDRERFELQDLLRSSAEVLGSGSFGSTYKAVISNGQAMVVKRIKQTNNISDEEFQDHMVRLGRLSHPNLLSYVAFSYRKEEKLLVSDFVANGSLASHLHGAQSRLDWPTRLKIIKGVAKGLAYLYNELPSVTLPHGHLKSSNVLLDQTFEPLLADYGLVPLINKEHAQQFMVAYKSPEFIQLYDRTTRKTDVWSLGILILELLTGKFPANYVKQGKGGKADLPTWVNSVVREEWTGEVFDKDMKATKNGEGEMLKLLKIGMCCCEWNVERRWELKEAVGKIEELKERDSDIEDYSSYGSESEAYSSRAITEDDFSFSVHA